jgi:hypothetical protein
MSTMKQRPSNLGHITLGEALGDGSIEIREVSEGGSVPELRVVNRAGKEAIRPFNNFLNNNSILAMLNFLKSPPFPWTSPYINSVATWRGWS